MCQTLIGTVDGYAIKASDSYGASDSIPSILNIIGEVKMGEVANKTIKSERPIRSHRWHDTRWG